MRRSCCLGLGLVACLLTQVATADEAKVIAVEATPSVAGAWRFSVTISHGDTGWEHYADKWQVIGPDGGLLGERVLLHPHVDEQPFTRSLGGIAIPEGIDAVRVRAHDTIHGWGPPVVFTLPDR
jgi:hypothetical protein